MEFLIWHGHCSWMFLVAFYNESTMLKEKVLVRCTMSTYSTCIMLYLDILACHETRHFSLGQSPNIKGRGDNGP